MKKWNKYDTQFIIRSLAISAIAILIWSYFYSGQINKNYLNIPLNEQEAKQKAVQYLGSRGWDITGYKYSCKYSKGWVNWWVEDEYKNYIKENLTDKNIDEIENIDKLTGENRWNMRWYNPPSSEEYQVSFTKNGDLTFFHHIIPDTLAGDSIPDDIAYNIAVTFLKNMTNINWQENDWTLQRSSHTKQENRMDHYFQLENKLYSYEQIHDGHSDKSTIRTSIRVKGSQIARYNRWLEDPSDTNKNFTDWAITSDFLDKLHEFIGDFITVICLLVSLFYFKISTKWKTAAKYAIFLSCIYLLKEFLEIPWKIYDFDSEDTFLGSITTVSFDALLNTLYYAVGFLLLVSGCEKFYRYIFPEHLSFNSILNPSCYSSKIFFNNYSAGIVFGLCILAFSGFFYTLVDYSSYYIAYPFLDLNQMLTYNPLLYLLTLGVHFSFFKILPYVFIILLIYLLTNSKIISIFISSLLFSIEGVLYTDPIFLGCIYLFIIGIASGYILFRYGILSLLVSTFCVFILSHVFLYFYTSQVYYVTTSLILILLLLSPLIYSLLHYLKHEYHTDSIQLLNSAIPSKELITTEPASPKHEPIETGHHKWGLIFFAIGMFCLFIPTNDSFNELFHFKISKSEALEKAKNYIEKDINEDISDFDVAIAQLDGFRMGWSGDKLGPFSNMRTFMSPRISYINEKVGREGIVKLVKKYNIPLNSWMIKFYKPNDDEGYLAALNSNDGQMSFYNHSISDSLALPTVTQKEAINITFNHLTTQNIDTSNFIFSHRFENNHNVRLDQITEFKKELTLDNELIADQIINTGVWGNTLGFFVSMVDVPQNWSREYWKTDLMYFLNTYFPLFLMILSLMFGLFYLVKNSINDRKIISWNFISIIIIFIIFIFTIDFLNMLSVQPTWYWGGTSWLTFWLDKIGSSLNDLSQLNFYLIIPILCAYLINPTIKNLSSQKSLELSSKDAFVGSLATLGIVFICKYVKDLLFTSFPHYIDMSFHIFDVHNIFAASIPGVGLFLKIATETLLLFSFSIFFYHKFIEYSSQGKNIQKYLLLSIVSLFYLFNMSTFQSTIYMIPHFIYRAFSLTMFFVLIKYFWKGNPLSHLFGILIFFELDFILSFISFADSSIKFHGWVLIVLMGILFVSTVGIGAYRSRLASNSV